MKQAVVKLRSEENSNYQQSKFHSTKKLERELDKDFERRTWREKLHVNESGNVVIPATQFAQSLRTAAKYLSIPIPGKGKSTYTKHFEAGILVLNDAVLPVKKEDVPFEAVFVPSNGQKGGGKRVVKYFPTIKSWKATITYTILDEIITPSVFERVLKASGAFIGIGAWRPINGGLNGRFNVESIEWVDDI